MLRVHFVISCVQSEIRDVVIDSLITMCWCVVFLCVYAWFFYVFHCVLTAWHNNNNNEHYVVNASLLRSLVCLSVCNIDASHQKFAKFLPATKNSPEKFIVCHYPPNFDVYRDGGRDQCSFSVILSVVLSVSRITAKVLSRFHWNLVLWLGLPVWRTDELLVVIQSQIQIPDHFSTSLTIAE